MVYDTVILTAYAFDSVLIFLRIIVMYVYIAHRNNVTAACLNNASHKLRVWKALGR